MLKVQMNELHLAIKAGDVDSLRIALTIIDDILDDMNKPHDELWDDEELEEFENELEELSNFPLDESTDTSEHKQQHRQPKRNIHKTKTIHRIDNKSIEQHLWTSFLHDLDLALSRYHDCNDLIIISSAYGIHHIMRALDSSLDQLHLSYASSVIKQFLFGNLHSIETKVKNCGNSSMINMNHIDEWSQTMAIIIIDVKSSESVLLPIYATDMMLDSMEIHKKSRFKLKTMMNGISRIVGKKRHYEYPLCGYWKVRWSIDVGYTSINWQNIMNDLCNEWSKKKKIMKHFKMYIGVPVSFMTKHRVMIQCLSKQIAFIQKQIKFTKKHKKSLYIHSKGGIFDEASMLLIEEFLTEIESKAEEMKSLKDIYIRYNAMMQV